MGIYLAEQTAFFLQSVLLGAAFGLLYDAFRVTRVAIPTAGALVFAEDVLFFAVCAASTFFFLMRTIDGQVRFFVLVGEGLGLLLYFMTLSAPVMRASETVIDVIKRFLQFIFRCLLLPAWRLLYWICTQLLRPVRFLGHFFKKRAQRFKYRLKIRRKVLYNQLRSVFPARKRTRKPKDAKKKAKP